MKIHSRNVSEADLEEMRSLLLRDGPNEWNYITDDSIEEQFELIRSGKAVVVLAEENEIHGFSVLIFKEACPAILSKYDDLSSIAYIADVVVSANQHGRRFGSKLLLQCIELARIENCTSVYIKRHESNLASAGMMRKAGFEIVETYFDPDKRDAGSRNTSVLVKST